MQNSSIRDLNPIQILDMELQSLADLLLLDLSESENPNYFQIIGDMRKYMRFINLLVDIAKREAIKEIANSKLP